jgi:hypothetical protein
MSVGTGLTDGVFERQLHGAEPGPLTVSIGVGCRYSLGIAGRQQCGAYPILMAECRECEGQPTSPLEWQLLNAYLTVECVRCPVLAGQDPS